MRLGDDLPQDPRNVPQVLKAEKRMAGWCKAALMVRLLGVLPFLLAGVFRSRHDLLLENLALRQQLGVPRQRHGRPQFSAQDKSFWVMLRRLWPEWKRALILVQPETVVRWHRSGIKLNWAHAGRKWVSRELHELIFRMVTENPTWGAPRIHGELKMLGLGISERTVLRWMRRNHGHCKQKTDSSRPAFHSRFRSIRHRAKRFPRRGRHMSERNPAI